MKKISRYYGNGLVTNEGQMIKFKIFKEWKTLNLILEIIHIQNNSLLWHFFLLFIYPLSQRF